MDARIVNIVNKFIILFIQQVLRINQQISISKYLNEIMKGKKKETEIKIEFGKQIDLRKNYRLN